ncbi:MAG: RNA polymerase, sigma subunit, SigV [Lachnoclostridium sp.]|jgi:RNA polymerase sigma-70 factor, ECF subfamily
MFSREKETNRKEEIVEQIICEKYNSYYRMAYSYVHNDADASDLVQEGAYKAIKNSGSLKHIEYAGSWVYRIMLNEIFRFLNEKKPLSIEEEEYMGPPSEDYYENIDLKKALNSISPKDRAVIQLKYYDELKLEEIARILGENLSTVKSRLYRGLKKLKVALGDCNEGS